MEIHQESVSPTDDINSTDPAQAGQSSDQADANTNQTEPTSSSESDAKSSPEASLSSVVEKALKDGKEGTSPSVTKPQVDQKSKGVPADPKAAQAKVDTQADDIPKEFHKHPAWVRMKNERDKARSEVEQYKTSAEEFGIVTGYMEENNIPVDEVVEALRWLALKNNDPVAFMDTLSKFKAEFDEEMGMVLSPELQARVESGEISEEDAKELQRSKAEARLYKDRETQRAVKSRESKAEDDKTELANKMAQTVNEWQKGIVLKDPDYAVKHDLVEAKIRAFIQLNGMPKDPQQALRYAQVAYDQVTKKLNEIAPKRKPNTPTPQTGRQTETQFVPKSLEDVVSNVLSGGQ